MRIFVSILFLLFGIFIIILFLPDYFYQAINFYFKIDFAQNKLNEITKVKAELVFGYLFLFFVIHNKPFSFLTKKVSLFFISICIIFFGFLVGIMINCLLFQHIQNGFRSINIMDSIKLWILMPASILLLIALKIVVPKPGSKL